MKARRELVFLLFLVLLTGCKHQSTTQHALRSAYYWSTSWRNDSLVASRVKGLNKLYLRFFDVVLSREGNSTPNATLQFAAKLPHHLEVIPVVFITNDVMKSGYSHSKRASD